MSTPDFLLTWQHTVYGFNLQQGPVNQDFHKLHQSRLIQTDVVLSLSAVYLLIPNYWNMSVCVLETKSAATAGFLQTVPTVMNSTSCFCHRDANKGRVNGNRGQLTVCIQCKTKRLNTQRYARR